MKATVVRGRSVAYGTPSTLTLEGGWSCRCLELPWANNERGRSCIKADTYAAAIWESPHLGSPNRETVTRADGTAFDLHRKVYRLEDKHGRADCLIHNANFAGEVNDGQMTQLHGCIAPGAGYAEIERPDGGGKQWGITASVKTLEELIRQTKGENLEILITWAEGENSEEPTP